MTTPTQAADPVAILRDLLIESQTYIGGDWCQRRDAALEDVLFATERAAIQPARSPYVLGVKPSNWDKQVAAIQPAGEAVQRYTNDGEGNMIESDDGVWCYYQDAQHADKAGQTANNLLDSHINHTAKTLYPPSTVISKPEGKTEASELPQEFDADLWAAVAQGWCAKGNTHKVMDTTLAEAIVRNVQRALAARPPVTTTQCADEGAVRICPEYDRECGEFKRGWCDTCPKHMSISDPEMSVWRESVEGITISASPPVAAADAQAIYQCEGESSEGRSCWVDTTKERYESAKSRGFEVRTVYLKSSPAVRSAEPTGGVK